MGKNPVRGEDLHKTCFQDIQACAVSLYSDKGWNFYDFVQLTFLIWADLAFLCV